VSALLGGLEGVRSTAAAARLARRARRKRCASVQCDLCASAQVRRRWTST